MKIPKNSRIKNRIGDRIGKLVVVELHKKVGSKLYWYCDCDCGTENHSVCTNHLSSKKQKSCGCISQPNIINKKFGKFLVIEKINKRKNNRIQYKCKCDCGGVITLDRTMLKGSRVRKNCPNCKVRKELVRKRFGKLVVLKTTDKRVSIGKTMHSYECVCICDCGNIFPTIEHRLITKNTKSCGCLVEEMKPLNKKQMTAWSIQNKQQMTLGNTLNLTWEKSKQLIQDAQRIQIA